MHDPDFGGLRIQIYGCVGEHSQTNLLFLSRIEMYEVSKSTALYILKNLHIEETRRLYIEETRGQDLHRFK